jgi:hypothetical protein
LIEHSVDPRTLAGDPLAHAGDHLHACIDGYVYIGHMVEDDHGEEVEVIEAVPCRRCEEAS